MKMLKKMTVRTAAMASTLGLAALIAAAVASIGVAGERQAPPTGTEPCSRAQTKAGLSAFMRAFNSGSLEKLDSLFAEEPTFQWYSSPSPGRRLGKAAKRRDTLVDYFRRRHAKDDRMRLLAFHLTRGSGRWSNFWFEGTRAADDFGDGKPYEMTSKGVMTCDEGSPRIFVFSLGAPEPRD